MTRAGAVGLALALAACSGEPAAPVAPPLAAIAPHDTGLIGEPVAAIDEWATTVELLEPGAEPRRILRYAVPPGTVEEIEVVSGGTMRAEFDGNPGLAGPMPETRASFSVRHRGDGRYEIAIGSAVMPDFAFGYLNATDGAKADLGGHRFEVAVSERGLLTAELDRLDAEFGQIPDQLGVATLLGAIVDAVGVPLPDEPVGVGARWRIRRRLPSEVGGFDAVKLYRLAGSTGPRLRLEETVERLEALDPAQGMPWIRVEATESSGGGERVIALDRVVPREVTLRMRMFMAMSLIPEMGGERLANTVNADLRVTGR